MPTLQNTVGVSDATFYPNPDSNQVEQSRYISHVAKFKPSSTVIYKKYTGFKTAKTEAELLNLERGKNGEYNGFMSPATARKVRTLLENWLLALEQEITDDWKVDPKIAFADARKPEYYPTFVTLTLPAKQIHDDNFIKRYMLMRFIGELKRLHGVRHYFWRAEPQKNGNIHFHILIDKWIHWKAIRHDWNRILDDHGYIDAYRQNQQARHANGYKPDRKELHERIRKVQDFHHETNPAKPFDVKNETKRILQRMREAYETGIKTNWSDPNSTDIHAIEKVDSITAYVVKYVCKTDGADEVRALNEDQTEEIITTRSRKINGRIWGCSDGLRNLKHFEDSIATEVDFHVMVHDNEAFEFVCHLEREHEANPDVDNVWKDEDSGTTIYQLDGKTHAILRAQFPALFAQYSQYYRTMYIELYDKRQYYANDILKNTLLFGKFGGQSKPTDTASHEKTNTVPDFSNWFRFTDDCPF